MSTLRVKNFSKSVLGAGLAAADATLEVAAGDGIKFPLTGEFRAVIWSDSYSSPVNDPNREIVTLEFSGTTDIFTIIARGREDTSTPADWYADDHIAHTITAEKISEIEGLIYLTQSKTNALINGACQVKQRANVTLSGTLGNYTYCLDRLAGMISGASLTAGTITQGTGQYGTTDNGKTFHFSAFTCSGAPAKVNVRYRMEAADAARFYGKNVSISCVVSHDVGSALDAYVTVNYADSADDFSSVTNAGTSATQNILSGTKTELKYENLILGNSANGIEIIFTVELTSATTKNMHFGEMQIELGEKSTAFVYPLLTDTYEKCKRYYQVFAPGTIVYPRLTGDAAGAVALYFSFQLGVTMRAAPTITVAGTWVSTNCAGPTAGIAAPQGITLYITADGAGLCDCYPDSADDTIVLNAEL